MTVRTPPAHDSGFTLIEALVAMAVLAVGATSLLVATQQNTARITALTDRMTARWVAENRLAELRMGPAEAGLGAEPVPMAGRDWSVAVTRAETTDPALVRVTVSVGQGDGQLVALTGYLDEGATP